jgi:hypothetical protein
LLPSPRQSLTLSTTKHGTARDRIASRVLHLCGQLSPFTSSVEQLWINLRHYFVRSEQWLQLFGAFRSVRDLHLWCLSWKEHPAIFMEFALEDSTKMEVCQEVFPLLRFLRTNEIRILTSDTHGISAFVNARRRTGRPLAVVRRAQE